VGIRVQGLGFGDWGLGSRGWDSITTGLGFRV
jgi:hypothetical protein